MADPGTGDRGGYPSSSLSSQSNAAAACGGFAAERRTRKTYQSIDSAGRPAATATQPGATARCSAANAGNVMLRDELRRLNTDGLISILLQFQQYSLLVQLCMKI